MAENLANAIRRASITVLAGCNGAGKSSVAGAALESEGGTYFNPDLVARQLTEIARANNLSPTAAQVNAAAWQRGFQLLQRAIATHSNFAFETTLGGHSITAALVQAIDAGIDVRIWFVGLASVELHIARVRNRVARGGHDIPIEKIVERYNAAAANLIRLLPGLAELALFDNSTEGDPAAGIAPQPQKVLHTIDGRIVVPANLSTLRATAGWAKPIVAAALQHHQTLV